MREVAGGKAVDALPDAHVERSQKLVGQGAGTRTVGSGRTIPEVADVHALED